jgi:predicted RNase H-like HicB family nuclease
MARRRKMTPEESAEWEARRERSRRFRELLELRQARDEELRAARVQGLTEIEFVFEPQEEGGYHVYAPDLPGLRSQGETLDEATANAEEALRLYVVGLRAAGRLMGAGVVRRKLPLPA